MKVGICSLGCKVNIYESELVTNILKNNNYTVVDFEDKADIYIINTCSVTNESDKKSRKMINRAKKNNPAWGLTVSKATAEAEETESAKQFRRTP